MFTTAQTRDQIRIQTDAPDAAVQLGTASASARVLQLQLGIDLMFITYRRTGGIFALLTFAAVAFAATVLTVVVAATLLIVALGTAAAVLLARAVLPASWRHHTIPRPTPRPRDTIEATVVRTAMPNFSSAQTVAFERRS